VDPLPEGRSNTTPVPYVYPGVNTEFWTPQVYDSLRAKEDAISAARKGIFSGIEKTSKCASFFKPRPRKTVAIAGGGIGGLTVAHELQERGYDVTIYEASNIFGGKAAAEEFNDNLFRDHSIKNISGYYYCLLETMKRIPYDGPVLDDEDEDEDDEDDEEEEGKEDDEQKQPVAETEVQDHLAAGYNRKEAEKAKKAKEELAKKEKKAKEKKAKEAAKRKADKAKKRAAAKKKARSLSPSAKAKKEEEAKKKRTVFGNLRSYDFLKCQFPDGRVYDYDTKLSSIFTTLRDFQNLKAALNQEGIPSRKVDKFLWKHLRLLFMCNERKRTNLDAISYERYLDLDVQEHEEYKLIQNLIEVTAAVKMNGSAWVGADQALKMFGKLFNPHGLKKEGNILNGNIDDKFLYPWVRHIRSLGGRAHLNKPLQRVLVDPKDDKKISGFQLADGSVVTADHYVIALPYSKLKYVINDSMLVDDFSRSIPALTNLRGEKWGHNCHFALKSLPKGAKPSQVYAAMGSPWAIVFYYVTRKLWKDGSHLSEEAPVQLWVTTSDASTPGILHQKPYSQCTPKEFMEELLCQIQFREADRDLIVDTVVGQGLNWWSAEEGKTIVPSVDPATLTYWGAALSAKGAAKYNARPGPAAAAEAAPTAEAKDHGKKLQASPELQLSEQVLINGPDLHGERVNQISEGLQIVCDAPLYAREVSMQEFETKTLFKNLFLAGECVKTIQLCSTMEKANEAGKRCAHAICKSDGRSYPTSKFQYDPLPFHFVRAIDSVIFGIFN